MFFSFVVVMRKVLAWLQWPKAVQPHGEKLPLFVSMDETCCE